jgi:aconitate hydratase
MCNYLGTVDIDFEIQPLGYSPDNKPVFLRDIYPTRKEIQAVEQQFVIPAMFQQVYSRITKGSDSWNKLEAPQYDLYPWNESSTYIKKPPFFDDMTKDIPSIQSIKEAHALLFLGVSVTTDHISPVFHRVSKNFVVIGSTIKEQLFIGWQHYIALLLDI